MLHLRKYLQVYFFGRSDLDPIPDNPQHEQYVSGLVNSLITEIEAKANSMSDNDFLMKFKLQETAKIFTQRYRFDFCMKIQILFLHRDINLIFAQRYRIDFCTKTQIRFLYKDTDLISALNH